MQNNNVYNKNLLEQLQNSKNPVIFWGSSLFLEQFLKENDCKGYKILGIIDKNPQKWGTSINSYEIFSADILKNSNKVDIIFTVQSNSDVNYSILKRELIKYPNANLLANIFFDSHLEELKQIQKQNTELIHAEIFNNLILNSNWVIKKDFIPIEGAANYSFLFLLYVVLEYLCPDKILEFGLGQTSKLTTQYIVNKKPKAFLNIIEHDTGWYNYFSSQICSNKNIKIDLLPLVKFEQDSSINDKYGNLEKIIEKTRYNLFIIDGPIGSKKKYPRTNILDLIPANLADDFIIIFDDVDREGEMNTVTSLLEKLDKNELKYSYKFKKSTKHQLVIASEAYRFATFY